MVGRLNDKKSGEHGPLHETIETADRLGKRLQGLVDEDAAAFTRLMACWRLPDDDPTKAAGKEAATIAATETPLEIMSRAHEVMALARVGLEKSKKNCLSDAGVAAFMAHAALEGARLNVMINLPGIADQEKRAELRSRSDKLRAHARSLRAEIDRAVDAS
jgi:formiminotetrahydrofolate cyclodeaminase